MDVARAALDDGFLAGRVGHGFVWLSLLGVSGTPAHAAVNESVEIDPFNSNRMMYGTGATLYGTTQLTNWDANTQFAIKPMAKGIEETAVLDLASPPSGAPLVSALGDISGFYHADLDAVQPSIHDTPSLTSNTSLDFAELSLAVFTRHFERTHATRVVFA